jgi:hypothetical protein
MQVSSGGDVMIVSAFSVLVLKISAILPSYGD